MPNASSWIRAGRALRRAISASALFVTLALFASQEARGAGAAAAELGSAGQRSEALFAPGAEQVFATAPWPAGSIVQVEVDLPAFDLSEADAVEVSIEAEGQRAVGKVLNAGDTSMHVPVRVGAAGPLSIRARSSAARELPLRLGAAPLLSEAELAAGDAVAFEAEPNNSFREAQPMKIGRAVYGNNDDADYLDNKDEAPVKGFANGLDNAVRDRPGLDWFRIDAENDEPRLVIFELDVLDRDVSVNLRMYRMNAEGSDVELYLDGKDPMEIIHDREPERYSKSISRTIKRGTYFLQVNGNHPKYILRSKEYPLPPYADARDAVRAGAHYIMNVGDAWVAQVPREGNIYNRAQNQHDSTLRCTACHPSIFSTETVLTAVKAGYPIESKSNFQYVVDRIYNGPSPMYGPADVNWQRYIAIPLQSQGKHGGILMDFEKYVSRRETNTFLRYAPFLRHAWTGREKLPDDEQNGVVPADSNVGYAVRDWRVMAEAHRRTGDRSYEQIADNIRAIVTGEKCDQKNIQDKIHRIWALALMRETPGEYAGELTAAIEEMMGYQNADGGWPDVLEPGRASAVYTTGQVVWTLAQAGESLGSRPKLKEAVGYLLSQQQDFGGWFQTTTHENFRTPMRETRYAVMALAAMHPIAAEPRVGWGNRDGAEARLPESPSLLAALDGLDNLWEVPEARREEFTQALVALLADPRPHLRASAAEALGRVGSSSAIAPLIAQLADADKDSARAAAWAVRQFGNRGEGLDAIQAALRSNEPSTRRGAVRIFAHHFFGMDERLDLARDVMKLTRDPDLWTRLQAMKTSREWFYRTGENGVKREIVDLYIDLMAKPDHPAVRSNLAQGMYIMLDENLAGGVSLDRNIAQFPYERDREMSIDARKHVEQAVLLEPVLAALANGNALQREALLASFDGTFFAGRFYARNPRNMIDVGNDREFNFYHVPAPAALERVWSALLAADLPAGSRAQALQLASFFNVGRDGSDPALQSMFLAALSAPEPEVRAAALGLAREDLALRGAEASPAIVERVLALLASEDKDVRLAALAAAKRNPALLRAAPIEAHLRAAIESGSDPALAVALLDSDLVSLEQSAKIAEENWLEIESEAERIALVERLFARGGEVDASEPSRDLVKVLRMIALDPAAGVREKLLGLLEKSQNLRSSPRIASVLYSGLSDASPGIRLRSLKLARGQAEFWKEGDAYEYALRLLIDPDPKIRDLALASVAEFDLIAREPRFARRVKALCSDAALGARAQELLAAKGIDAAAIEPDGAVQSYGIPDIEFFREKVNPYFYAEAADGHSCFDCHQNHNILRITAMPGEDGPALEDSIIQNLNSALKVVNLGDPEQSLILRKPRSPQGQGTASAESPTGLTHVGGPRWPASADPGYQAVLAWIRDAASSMERRLGVSASVDSYSPDYPAKYALDGDPQTIWHTEFVGAVPPFPHEIVIDLGAPSRVAAFQYVPRQESPNGRVKEWELYASADGADWGEKLASGEWSDDAAVKTVSLRASGIRYVKLRGLSSVTGEPIMSAAEVIVLKAREETQTAAAGGR